MATQLTIGLAVYDDFQGAWFTLQSLALHHDLRDVELVVVDNHPDGPEGGMLKDYCHKLALHHHATRYLPLPSPVGTSPPRQRLFDEASGDWVLALDSHVLLFPGVVARIKDFIAAPTPPCGPDDLYHGPNVYDDGVNVNTHFADAWRGEMWGVWGCDPRIWKTPPGGPIRPELDPEAPPFEIPGSGLGLFLARKDAWVGFHPKQRGFGGEEMYVHEKYRRRGDRVWCLPWLRWSHRYGRLVVPYPLTRRAKVRNYILALQELGLPLDPCRRHFVDEVGMPAAEFDRLVQDPDSIDEQSYFPEERAAKPCVGCSGTVRSDATLEDLYAEAASRPSDINEHVPKLRELASQCDHVTEFGMRHGVSTVALLAGQPKTLVTYDRTWNAIAKELEARRGGTDFRAVTGDVLQVEIEPTDLLFIDTIHTAAQLAAELARHAGKVRRWIVLHDTQIYGEIGEGGQPGLLVALRRYLREHPEWTVVYHTNANYGLTVISRDVRDKKPLPSLIKMAANFAKAIAGHIATGARRTPAEVLEKRLEICTLCDQRHDERCGVCGCPLVKESGEGKAQWLDQECPLGKWPVAEEK